LNRINVFIGNGRSDLLDDMGKRTIEAWHNAERGGGDSPEISVTFESMEAFLRHVTPKRLEMVRVLREHPAISVAALARQLGRDYKNVHEDVDALTTAGLIEKVGRSIKAVADEIVLKL
jgi:predicted transcriptional regulator